MFGSISDQTVPDLCASYSPPSDFPQLPPSQPPPPFVIPKEEPVSIKRRREEEEEEFGGGKGEGPGGLSLYAPGMTGEEVDVEEKGLKRRGGYG